MTGYNSCLPEIGTSFGVLFKISEEHLRLFCMEIPPPPSRSDLTGG